MVQARPITEVDSSEGTPVATAVPELDRVLGGGLVPGSVTLVGGEPGIGKSTLLLQVAAALARHGHPVLYVSAEESAAQVRDRAERLGAMHDGLWLLSETELPGILAALDEIGPALVVVDSIQTVIDPEIASSAGSVVQVRESAHRLVQEAKRRGVAIVLVGHVTKDGSLAGPRCWSTWSTRSSPSRETVTTPCGCCARSSTATAPPASWGCSRCRNPV